MRLNGLTRRVLHRALIRLESLNDTRPAAFAPQRHTGASMLGTKSAQFGLLGLCQAAG